MGLLPQLSLPQHGYFLAMSLPKGILRAALGVRTCRGLLLLTCLTRILLVVLGALPLLGARASLSHLSFLLASQFAASWVARCLLAVVSFGLAVAASWRGALLLCCTL